MKLNKILLVVLIAILLSFTLTFLFYTKFMIIEIQEMDMKMKIRDVVGLDTNSSVISFGSVPIGGSGRRTITLENKHDVSLRVYSKRSGEMARWVEVSLNKFVLEPGEKKELEVKATPSLDAEKGVYTGKVKFIFMRII